MRKFVKAMVLAMVLALVPATALASAEFAEFFADNEAVEAFVDSGVLVINATLEDGNPAGVFEIFPVPVPGFVNTSLGELPVLVAEQGAEFDFAAAYGENVEEFRALAWLLFTEAALADIDLAEGLDPAAGLLPDSHQIIAGDGFSLILADLGLYWFVLEDSTELLIRVASAEPVVEPEPEPEVVEEPEVEPELIPEPEVAEPLPEITPPIVEVPEPPVVVPEPVIPDPIVVPEPAPAVNTGVVYNCHFLNLRRGPGVDHAAFSYLAAGDVVTILDRTAWGWLQVSTHRGEGWVYGGFINEGN